MAKITTRKLKSGEERIYVGGKSATKEQKKEYFKSNLQADFSQLSKEDRRLAGAIKGGLKRAQQSERVGGQFIGGSYQRAGKRLGIDLDVLAKAKGAKSIADLFAKEPELKEAFTDLTSGVGLPMWYNPSKALDVINDYTGKQIYINGNPVSKSQAKAILNKTDKELFRKFEFVDSSVKLTFDGKDRLNMTLPTSEDIDEYTDEEGDLFIEAWSGSYIIYQSSKKK